jgi:hypothetical protein
VGESEYRFLSTWQGIQFEASLRLPAEKVLAHRQLRLSLPQIEVRQQTSLVRKVDCISTLGGPAVALKYDRGTNHIGMLHMTRH